MGIRKSAADLTPDEIAAFLEAIARLKATKNNQGFSVYDQFVALHGAVMAVLTPTSGDRSVNFGHGNIGFLPWHRQYLRAFEQALSDALGEAVTLPYWDWSNAIGASNVLFTPEFLSSLRWGSPQDVTDGILQFTIAGSSRPPWWPSGLVGFRVDSLLSESRGTALERGSMESDWSPSEAMLNTLTQVNQSINGRHPLWVFWLILEQGVAQLPQTHNAGHRFIGGHMGGAFSPNDPVFWLHHANVDRLWANWQQHRIDNNLSANWLDTYPLPEEESPFDGSIAPEGHKVGDAMWPWNGDLAGYTSVSVSSAIRNRLPEFSDRVLVEDVLDTAALGITYQPPL
ncbi:MULTISPECIES: tyrosinase family protein [unclassified Vibrio]|uniref:tyrosinase family protein n=1 Tax=unclassified Vibrio TaxID=2614977 RepID=UPI001361B439|nr:MULTISPECIES: tyrosinase family protein [unclassified Vibrio]NAW58183.1 hypothetical protein [Vibrio sp. V36_P2S2PM302]NAX25090.1 hypothetical protein [Vibrio sp. V38_P2S17PM301]NAX28673.1 hypothetical protein [Vibrio sp. V37_P2S8PM304]